MGKEFLFTNDWFNITAKRNWQSLLPQVKPTKILEIGSFEGNSICFLAENNDWCDELKVFCVDTWEGSIEHKERHLNMSEVEKRFDHNIELAQEISQKNIEVTKLKGFSDYHLSKLISDGFANYFDFVYSINTLHNLHNYDLDKALQEMERVGKKNKYICVESYRNEVEKTNLLYWQVTCEAFCNPEEWEWWFKQAGYAGDHSFIYFE